VTVYLKNIAHREAVNTVRKEYFGAHRPASTLIEISQFVRPELLIEIETTAVLPEKKAGGSRRKARAGAPARKVRRRR
jgi:2-iminobutanoate/2-iminopropanoate deaminase